MLSILLAALLAVLPAGSPPAHDTEFVVTFTRALTVVDASRLLSDVAPGAEITSTTFEPLKLAVPARAVPTQAQVGALLRAGAITVGTLSHEAQLRAIGLEPLEMFGDDLSGVAEQSLLRAPYTIRIEFPGGWTSVRALDAAERILGARPNSVAKTANVMRLAVASGDAEAVRARLLQRPEVVSVEAR